MTEPRVPVLGDDDARAAAERAGVPDYVTVLNVNRVLLAHPRIARNFVQYFWDLMYENALEPRLRELAILRIGWVTGSVYEWTQHWHIAAGMGIPDDDLLGVRDWEAHDGFSDADRAILAATDDVLEHGAIGPQAWAHLARHLPNDAERIEAIAAIAGWRMVATLLQSLDVPLEDGTDPWPPDGVAPEGAG